MAKLAFDFKHTNKAYEDILSSIWINFKNFLLLEAKNIS
jgi:hypothetical protein